MSSPAGVNGAGDFVWLIVSPPMSNVSIDMLEQELFQEKLQNCGIHATFIGLDGIPGERDEIAAYSMEASRRTELIYHHVPHKYCALSTEPSMPVVTCTSIIQPSCSTLVDAFPLGVTMPEGHPVPMMSACWRPAEREIPKCVGCLSCGSGSTGYGCTCRPVDCLNHFSCLPIYSLHQLLACTFLCSPSP